MIQTPRLIAVSILCLALASCSTLRLKTGGDAAHASARNSSFEITYYLGEHGQHRLAGFSTHSSPQLAAYLERSVIEERTVRSDQYDDYFSKIVDFAQRTQRAPSQNYECRAPFAIVAKIDGKTYSSKGCRTSKDDSSFSKLLREGEFLLYSKN